MIKTIGCSIAATVVSSLILSGINYYINNRKVINANIKHDIKEKGFSLKRS